MQIFKRMINNKKRSRAQNIIELVFVFPILIFMTLVIFEVALFWQDVNSVYNLNAEINANIALIDNSGMSLGDRCTAAKAAIEILKKKDAMISLNDPSYNDEIAPKVPTPIDDPDLVLYGKEPFALYTYKSSKMKGSTKPQIALWVDCRNPFENGVTTQLEFFHKTLIVKASIPRFDGGSPIDVIPENIFISSPKLNTIRHY